MHRTSRVLASAAVRPLRAIAILAAMAASAASSADEGMWLPNALPIERMKAEHGFTGSPEMFEHLQKAAVRFSTGGSGSIISPRGLVMTNHHVGSEMLLKLSTPERNLMKQGFHARTADEELRCPDLELNVLWSIEDVTDRLAAAAGEGAEAMTAAAAAIQDECLKSTGMKGEVVSLYQGARHHLYRYRTYRDVRLVFAPEEAIAFFGGDADNFEFPRFDLDCCFFRIYENGKPLAPEHHLDWDTDGVQEGELVFTWGHPASTYRMYTADHVAYMRDVREPASLREYWRAEVRAATFMGRSRENARIAREDFFGVQNSRKATQGLLDALQDPALVARKRAEESALLERLKGRPEAEQFERGRAQVRQSLKAARRLAANYEAFEEGPMRSQLAEFARDILRMKAEDAKPSAERLPEYIESERETLEAGLYTAAPVQAELEIERLASWLSALAEERGLDAPMVRKLLAGKSPRARASELVRGTRLADIAARRAADPADPMIAFVATFDELARKSRKAWEDQVEAPQAQAYADIAAARFAAFGDSEYPDATFTLRMSYGTVRGWTTETGETVPAFTTIGGTFARAAEREGQEGFALPKSWLDARPRLNAATPYNFVSTNDIIGGNSGSPVVDADGELVGLIFDGNLDSLAGDVVFDIARNRAVSVDARALLEALRVVYGAEALVAEITTRGR